VVRKRRKTLNSLVKITSQAAAENVISPPQKAETCFYNIFFPLATINFFFQVKSGFKFTFLYVLDD
jgi:hypothetical protein